MQSLLDTNREHEGNAQSMRKSQDVCNDLNFNVMVINVIVHS